MKWREVLAALAVNNVIVLAAVFLLFGQPRVETHTLTLPAPSVSVAQAAPPTAVQPPAPARAPNARLDQPSGQAAYANCPPATDDQAWQRIHEEPWLPFLGQQVGVSPPGIARLKLCFDYAYGARYAGQMTTARWRATWEHRANLFALSLGLDPIYVADEPGADLFPRVKRTLEVYNIADSLGIQY